MKNQIRPMREAQINNVHIRSQRIEQILKQMQRNNIAPKNFTSISRYVSERLEEFEGKPCSASTLRRNDTYRHLIHRFMRETGYESEKRGVLPKSDVLSLQLRLKELERENFALQENLRKLLSQVAEKGDFNNTIRIPSKKLPKDISRICKIVHEMMEILDAFEVDLSNGTVVDKVTMSNVFTREYFPEFFEWYETIRR